MKFLYIALGGSLGAVCRYLVSGWFLRFGADFPLGTLVVNLLGALLLGFFMELSTRTLLIPPEIRLLVAVGFLGSFTTFSTFAYETGELLKEGEWIFFVLNVSLSVGLGLFGVKLGEALARVLVR
ncbi:fluoride efflux transporter CrcB [Thermosulfurimonas sp. F29]|uniref:fluoride efflux transporter CrcB n=1 Tax=Thermosulfurimonas sp. F29 TaxID=2867247 RepID=UPI001C82DF26|nr:fluoride efflux transporter CrcB [Thermosulfurimonas sp. F29]MBX6422716.1 fluoride efflux transporter CrcB [Thermosulfurimonas sp. F29]